MNKYFIIILLLLASCKTDKQKETVIKATFPDFKDTVVYFYHNGIMDTILLDTGKSFVRKVTIDKPVLYMVRAYRTRVYFYASPNDTTGFTMNCSSAANFPEFKGAYAGINHYMAKSYRLMKDVSNSLYASLASEKPLFDKKLDSAGKLLHNKLDSMADISKELISLEKSRIDYFLKKILADYIENNASYTNKDTKPDSIDFSFLKDLDLNNAGHLMFDDYASLVERYMFYLFKKKYKEEKHDKQPVDEQKKDFYAFIDSNITNQEVKDHIKMLNLKDEINYGKFYELGGLVDSYLKNCKTEKYKTAIRNLFHKRMLIAPGKVAPDFKYNDINGKEYALSDFKGTLLYMDIWATW